MKSSSLLFIAAFAAGSVPAADKAGKPSKVTVTFHESDKFTDARSTMGGSTDQYYLDELGSHLQKIAAKYVAPGEKLEVTFTDVDLAGDFEPGRADMQSVRIVKDIYLPRLTLNFRLIDADGKVLKEGERKLTDMNFLSNISIIDRNQPLFYDKPLLKNWVEKEFKK